MITLPYILAGILAILGQLSDCFTTQIALAHGAHEANPLMVKVVAHPFLSYPLKAALAIWVTVVCHKQYSPKKSGIAPILLTATIGFGAALWNLGIISSLK